jgi:hypothetical protein
MQIGMLAEIGGKLADGLLLRPFGLHVVDRIVMVARQRRKEPIKPALAVVLASLLIPTYNQHGTGSSQPFGQECTSI